MHKYFFHKNDPFESKSVHDRAIALSNPRSDENSITRPAQNPFHIESVAPFERTTSAEFSARSRDELRRISKKFHRTFPVCRDRRCYVINVTERSRAIFSPGRNRPGSDHVQPITGRIRRCLFTRLVYNGAPPRNDYRRSTIEGFIVPFAGRLSNSRWLTTRETEREGTDPRGEREREKERGLPDNAMERCTRVGVPIPLHLSLRCFIRRYLSTDTPGHVFATLNQTRDRSYRLERKLESFFLPNGASSLSRRLGSHGEPARLLKNVCGNIVNGLTTRFQLIASARSEERGGSRG